MKCVSLLPVIYTLYITLSVMPEQKVLVLILLLRYY